MDWRERCGKKLVSTQDAMKAVREPLDMQEEQGQAVSQPETPTGESSGQTARSETGAGDPQSGRR